MVQKAGVALRSPGRDPLTPGLRRPRCSGVWKRFHSNTLTPAADWTLREGLFTNATRWRQLLISTGERSLFPRLYAEEPGEPQAAPHRLTFNQTAVLHLSPDLLCCVGALKSRLEAGGRAEQRETAAVDLVAVSELTTATHTLERTVADDQKHSTRTSQKILEVLGSFLLRLSFKITYEHTVFTSQYCPPVPATHSETTEQYII